MNIALILAGGTDKRFPMDVPKQFVNVFDKPLIVYTLQIFQNHPEIDAIMISCLEGWEEMVSAYAKQFDITKLKWVITGGGNGQMSSKNGVDELLKNGKEDDVVIIHDAIRPMVSDEIISNSIEICREKGMGVAALRSMDTIMMTEDGKSGEHSIARYGFRRIQTPQTYQLGKLAEAHELAIQKGIVKEVDTNSMLAKLGERIYFSKGSDINLKINTMEDIEIFKALYLMRNKGEQVS